MRRFKGMWRLTAILILAFTVLAGCSDDIPAAAPMDGEMSMSEETGGVFFGEGQPAPAQTAVTDGEEDDPAAIGPTPTPAYEDPEAVSLPEQTDAEPGNDPMQAQETTAPEPAEEDTEPAPDAVPAVEEAEAEPAPEAAIAEDGEYTSKKDVALYIHTYGKLPGNFITKKDAQALGWEGGSLEPYAPGKSIGGDRFGNYEGLLPDGRYKECDIDTKGKKSRGSKRIVFDDKGNIYYTGDHYESFTQLY